MNGMGLIGAAIAVAGAAIGASLGNGKLFQKQLSQWHVNLSYKADYK